MDLIEKGWAVLVANAIVNTRIDTGFVRSVCQTGLFNEGIMISGTEVQKSQLTLALTICSSVAPIPMTAGNGLQKKLKGPRNAMQLGGILFSMGLICTSSIHGLAMLYVACKLLCGFRVTSAYGITIGSMVRFFPDKRELTAGISATAYGADSIIFPPTIQSLIGSDGVMFTFRALRILSGVTTITAVCFITEPPEGWLPTGWTPSAMKNNSDTSAEGKNWKLILAGARFYLMIIAFTTFAAGGLTVVSQGSPMAWTISEVDTVTMTIVVSIISLTSTGGRVFWGWVSDKVRRYPALSIMTMTITISGFALSAFTENGSPALLLVFTMLIVMCYSGSVGVYPALMADAFGIKYNGANYGIMSTRFAPGGYIGPILVNSLYDNMESYSVLLMVMGAAGVVTLIILFVLTVMREQAQK